MQATIDVPGLKLEEVPPRGDETAFSVVMDGNDLGKVAFMKYYKPVAEELDP